MKLIIVRHGATDYNLNRVIQGQLDTDLNALGLEQANELGRALANEAFNVVLSSDLKRARRTTAAILKYHDMVTVEYTPDLRERNFGQHQNRPARELAEALEAFPGERENYRPYGGESLQDSHARAGRFWRNVQKEYGDATVLVSSHGGVCKSLLTHVLGRSLMFRRELAQDNCCINILSGSARDGYIAEQINSVAHLSRPTGMEGL